MDINRFKGCHVALVTPFEDDGEIDIPALNRLIDFHLKFRTDGLVISGTTGEGATLSDKQFEVLVEKTIKKVKGKIPITVGTGGNSTVTSIERTKWAKELGADAALVVGPYYNKPTQDGYYKHFRAIAEGVDIPIIAYNVPGRTAGMIDWRTLLRLALVPNIIAVKEASGNFDQITQLVRKRPADFLILSGDDILAMSQIAIGADGVISVAANEIPDLMRKLIHSALAGRFKMARQIYLQIYPLMSINFVETNPIPVKSALALMRLIKGNFHLPLVKITEINGYRLKNVLLDLDILSRSDYVNYSKC